MTAILLMTGAILLGLVILPLAGGWAMSPQRRLASARRAIERQEPIAVAALQEGELARIQGVVAAREPLMTSPIGRRRCIGYESIIEEPGNRGGPAKILSREAWPSFLVTDETGSIAVQGQLEILVAPSDSGVIPASGYALLKENEVRMNDLWGPRRFTFRETALKVGDRVSVLGRPSRAVGAASWSSEPVALRGTFDEPVVIDDEPAPG